MTVEVLNTGSELLLGEVVNTHAAWFGRELFPLGLRIARQTTVPDGAPIRQALIETVGRADIVLVTGGLGPTTDDMTREVAAELLGMPLVADEKIRAAIEARLSARGIPMRERMLRQTMVPRGATVLPNDHGTAPGLYLPAVEQGMTTTPHFFLLPGPPRELHPMFRTYALPVLKSLSGAEASRECRVYRVVGMGESEVEELIGLSIAADSRFEVGYCARPNEVDFRLIGAREDLDRVEPDVLCALGRCLVSQRGEAIEEWVVGHLAEHGWNVATAESCSGGLLANRLTNVPGASEVFRQGFVTYSNEAKSRALGVDPALIVANGAVSEPVAAAMAEGALREAMADFALSLTGIAGPGGGSEEKPVGTVFIGLAAHGAATVVKKCRFPTDRETFKQLATQAALDLLRQRMIDLTDGSAAG